MRSTEQMCVHRHSIRSHPKCFQKGLIRGEGSVNIRTKPKILLLDIETSPLLAMCFGIWEQNINIGAIVQDWHLICWSAKWLFDDVLIADVLTPEEAIAHDDSRICSGIWNLLDAADICITHNGNGFDLKRLSTRFLIHGLYPPKPYQSIDTLKVAKEVFNFTSNKLEFINSTLGLPEKGVTTFDLWRKCFYGDPQALSDMVSYNIQDTEILEDLYLRLRPYIRGHPNLNLWSSDNVSVCPNCGSDKLEWGGYYHTYTGRYKSFRCLGCGATGRSRSLDPEFTKEKRATIVR
jgi:hypothetical protein